MHSNYLFIQKKEKRAKQIANQKHQIRTENLQN